MENKFCPKCNAVLVEETNEFLKKEYEYLCESCDENFYEIEVLDEVKEGYSINDIDDYRNKITSEQSKALINHCNKFNIYPRICAWYDDMDDFYQDWVYDNNICEDEGYADERYEYGCEMGEFFKFNNGEIVRLSI